MKLVIKKFAVSISNGVILPAAMWPAFYSASNRNEYQQYLLEGYMLPVRRAHNITTFMCCLSWSVEDSTSWSSKNFSGHVMG
jgi:hypothetical protein